jgi:hypothetical protein
MSLLADHLSHLMARKLHAKPRIVRDLVLDMSLHHKELIYTILNV